MKLLPYFSAQSTTTSHDWSALYRPVQARTCENSPSGVRSSRARINLNLPHIALSFLHYSYAEFELHFDVDCIIKLLLYWRFHDARTW